MPYALLDTYDTGTSTSSSRSISITLTDAGNGKTATGNASVIWHDEIEPFYVDDSGSPYKVMGSDPDISSWPTYPWKNEVNPKTNVPDTLVGPQGAGQFSVSGTVTESTSVDGGIDIGKEPVGLHFGISKDINNNSQEVGVRVTVPAAIPAGYETWAVWRPNVTRNKGHGDVYDNLGYVGPGVWRKDTTAAIDHAVFYPYAKANSVFGDPPAGWNPPGYH